MFSSIFDPIFHANVICECYSICVWQVVQNSYPILETASDVFWHAEFFSYINLIYLK